MRSNSRAQAPRTGQRLLSSPNWSPAVRQRLEKLITENAGQRLPAVFDFDNTIVCGDIGEATLAILVRSGLIHRRRIPRTLSPRFRVGNKPVSLETAVDLTDYYDSYLAPTAHGARDPSPLSNGYVWAVEVMEGLTPAEVVAATRQAYELSKGPRPAWIEVTPGRTAFPAPFFYDEIVELIARLLEHDFSVWIISASNIWSVRWMVLNGLNPLLRRAGSKRTLDPSQVVGVATLLADKRKHLFKDSVLAQENRAYAALEPTALKQFRLTSRLQFPVPIYSGKVACLFDRLGRAPWLCVGDSPSDHPMLRYSEHRLWLARLEKPAYQKATVELVRRNAGWLVQPLLTGPQPGFVADLSAASQIAPDAAVRRSVALLSRL